MKHVLPIRQRENGAVSIFIVIFSALLIVTISVGFIRIMVKEQQQASTADLSRSALDSALGGVEDAKRALVVYRSQCLGTATMATPECVRLSNALTGPQTCDTIQKSGIAGAPDDQEVKIQQSEGDASLNQAYTCVKVQINTSDYVGELEAGASKLIPLRGTGSFNQVAVEWYSQEDLKDATPGGGAGTVQLAADAQLPKLADWPRNQPSLLRTQLIQFGDDFKLSDFDKVTDGDTTTSNARTLFLLPSEVGRAEGLSFADDSRLSQTSNVLQQVACNRDFTTVSTDGIYACRAVINLPSAVGESGDNRTAFLRLNSLYGAKTGFRIKLQNTSSSVPGDNSVLFGGVQPIVDSTGRANDLFKRVQSRIELDASSFPAPDAAVEVAGGDGAGDFCKTFFVADEARYYTPGDCTP